MGGVAVVDAVEGEAVAVAGVEKRQVAAMEQQERGRNTSSASIARSTGITQTDVLRRGKAAEKKPTMRRWRSSSRR
jgi:hypothetical protein